MQIKRGRFEVVQHPLLLVSQAAVNLQETLLIASDIDALVLAFAAPPDVTY